MHSCWNSDVCHSMWQLILSESSYHSRLLAAVVDHNCRSVLISCCLLLSHMYVTQKRSHLESYWLKRAAHLTASGAAPAQDAKGAAARTAHSTYCVCHPPDAFHRHLAARTPICYKRMKKKKISRSAFGLQTAHTLQRAGSEDVLIMHI